MMTQSEQKLFFKFKMKPIPLMVKVLIARGDYSAPKPTQPLEERVDKFVSGWQDAHPDIVVIGSTEVAGALQDFSGVEVRSVTEAAEITEDQWDNLKPVCKGIEIEPGVFSGCVATAGDCPECGQ
jgi:hypothetical protein